MKMQSTDWEKILANYISDKGLVSDIHKKLLEFNSRKTKNNRQQILQQRRDIDGK